MPIEAGRALECRLTHLIHGRAQRDTRLEVERDRDRGQLAGVVHRQRSDTGLDLRETRERHLLPLRRLDMEQAERRRILLILGRHAHDDLIGVVGRVDLRHLPRAERAVHRAFHLIRAQPQRGHAIAIQGDVHLRIRQEEIARHVLQARKLVHPALQLHRALVEVGRVRAGEGELVGRPGGPPADVDHGRIGKKRPHSRDRRQFRPE